MTVSQSEGHLVLKVEDSSVYKLGHVFYVMPYHICPSVALYERAFRAENNMITDEWKVIRRNRKIIV